MPPPDCRSPIIAVLNRRRNALIATAAAVILGGIAVGTGVTVAANAETVRQCDAARGKLSKASAVAKRATAAADTAVKKSEATQLPHTDGWTSKKYADKPASTAQPHGSSGKDRLAAVTTQQKKLQSLATAPTCESRGDAEAVTERAAVLAITSKQLTTAATDLADDFQTFQADETTRVAACVEVLKHNAIHHRQVKPPRRLTYSPGPIATRATKASWPEHVLASLVSTVSYSFPDDRTLYTVAVGEP